jgi:pimeloyl-ACP methyl ester carboxylesterase
MHPRRKKILAALGVLAAILVGLPYATDRERRALDEPLRRELESAGHTFASLSAGRLHYELSGPATGRLVVLVHGVSGPMMVWDRTVEPLRREGFRVLRFDHFGRGYSERTDRDYTLDLLVGSLEELLKSLGAEGPVDLVGSSMGAIVVSEFALRHPERVGRIGLLGPAGFPLEASPLAKLIEVPGVGDYLMRVAGDRSLAGHHRRYFNEPAPFEDFQRRFEAQLEFIGSKGAILSTMRHTPVQAFVDRYRALGQLDKEILIVWGRDDQAFPFSHHETALRALPRARFVPVDGAGHLPMLERPEVVTPELVSFLQSRP